MVEKMRAQGATQEELNQMIQENEQFKEWYKNPFFRYAMTMLEPFPVGLLITLISALILRRSSQSVTVSRTTPKLSPATG